MRLLLDQNLSHRPVDRLADLFPGSTQARLIGMDQTPDGAIWDHAARHGYAIITRDVGLADMATLRGPPPLVVWVRIGNSSTTAVEAALRAHHQNMFQAAADGGACIEIW